MVFDRDTKYVESELINKFEHISEYEEKTGLHEREFLDTYRYSFDDEVIIDLKQSINVGNMVEGIKAKIISVNDSFDPYEIHYAETFMLPEALKKVKVKCLDKNGCKIVTANVR